MRCRPSHSCNTYRRISGGRWRAATWNVIRDEVVLSDPDEDGERSLECCMPLSLLGSGAIILDAIRDNDRNRALE
jgi:hypothetical protein